MDFYTPFGNPPAILGEVIARFYGLLRAAGAFDSHCAPEALSIDPSITVNYVQLTVLGRSDKLDGFVLTSLENISYKALIVGAGFL